MAEIPDRLKLLLGKTGVSAGLMTGAQWQQTRTELTEEREQGKYDLERLIPGEEIGAGDSKFWLVRRDYPLEYMQGKLPLGAALESASEQIALSACDPDLEDFDPRTACFFDTETIGLAGGTGTVAFLIGAGYFIDGAFRLDQLFMRDFDEEEPMLEFLAERLRACETVVGYNSKSFDLPLLRTRFIQNRIPFRGDALPHYDLVHAVRRIWKRRLQDCSLGNVEREVLDFHRVGDVPSYLIPQQWFDFLRMRDARPLKKIFEHHRNDILSLVTLTGWMSRCLSSPHGGGLEHTEDRLSLVRVHYRQKNYDAVVEHGWKFIEMEDRSPLRRECLEMLGMALKRRQRFEEMQQAFELLLSEFPSDLNARIELVKLHEHRTRDWGAAQRLCEEGLTLIRERTSGRFDTQDALLGAVALEDRLGRLLKKMEKGLGARVKMKKGKGQANTAENEEEI